MQQNIIIPDGKFYVYTLARPVTGIFYVGKGIGQRIFGHEKEAKRGHKCHKCYVIRKVWREGGVIEKQIVFVAESEQEALDYERSLIAEYGMLKLVNVKYAGDISERPGKSIYEMTDLEMRHAVEIKNLKPRAKARELERMRGDKIQHLRSKEIGIRLQGRKEEAAAIRQEIKDILRVCEEDAAAWRKKLTR